ncbi:hypothetical protein IZY60_12165 [Lutibacter sp. B2]|nr:hypothetical protein [Lutibacter sp. B2]
MVVAKINDEATVKRFYKEQNWLQVYLENYKRQD